MRRKSSQGAGGISEIRGLRDSGIRLFSGFGQGGQKLGSGLLTELTAGSAPESIAHRDIDHPKVSISQALECRAG